MSDRPLLIDLYCGAGGASVGYHRAGFDVIGVDNQPQSEYPFEVRQADALAFLRGLAGATFDGREPVAIHASPPCQHHTDLAGGTNGNRGDYPELIVPTRELLVATGLPYIIENVVSAPLIDPITLCGEMFGLAVIRHRLFESNVDLEAPEHVKHRGRTRRIEHGVYKDGPYWGVHGHGGGHDGSVADWRVAMGIDWMTVRRSIAEAIPPVYSEHVGRQLIDQFWPAELVAR